MRIPDLQESLLATLCLMLIGLAIGAGLSRSRWLLALRVLVLINRAASAYDVAKARRVIHLCSLWLMLLGLSLLGLTSGWGPLHSPAAFTLSRALPCAALALWLPELLVALMSQSPQAAQEKQEELHAAETEALSRKLAAKERAELGEGVPASDNESARSSRRL